MGVFFEKLAECKPELIFNTMSEGVLIVDSNNLIVYCNKPGAEIRGVSVESIVGEPVLSCHSADSYKFVEKIINNLKNEKELFHKRVVNVSDRYFEITYSRLSGFKGEYLGIVAISRDITERILLEIELREKTDKLEGLLITDELTGLYNKKYFFEKIEEETKRFKRSNKPFYLLFFEVDNFKTINDLRGHLVGDKILKSIGEVVGNNIRKYIDYGFRYGGDEFIIILNDTNESAAITIAERIRILIKKISFEKVTVSFGIAESKKDYLPKTLMDYADAAMYKAKAEGGDSISVYVDLGM